MTCSSENRINTDLEDLAIGYFLRFLSKFLLYKEKKRFKDYQQESNIKPPDRLQAPNGQNQGKQVHPV